MNQGYRNTSGRWIVAIAIALALVAVSAYAVDVIVRPGAGDALSVRAQNDLELFRVAESGEIALPQPPPTVIGSEPLCREPNGGEVVRCGGSGYEVREEPFDVIMQAGVTVERTINCPSGTRVVSGGYWVQSVPPENLLVHRSEPNLIGTGWVIRVTNISGATDQLIGHLRVICADI